MANFKIIEGKFVEYPVLGEVKAGYDSPAEEEWNGDTLKVPISNISRNPGDYFVLRVKGDSMYPYIMDGDKVLVLKQNTMDEPGQLGVVLYDSEYATLKNVLYEEGEDWMTLEPLNPSYPPVTITGEDLNRCRILGIPVKIDRDVPKKVEIPDDALDLLANANF